MKTAMIMKYVRALDSIGLPTNTLSNSLKSKLSDNLCGRYITSTLPATTGVTNEYILFALNMKGTNKSTLIGCVKELVRIECELSNLNPAYHLSLIDDITSKVIRYTFVTKQKPDTCSECDSPKSLEKIYGRWVCPECSIKIEKYQIYINKGLNYGAARLKANLKA